MKKYQMSAARWLVKSLCGKTSVFVLSIVLCLSFAAKAQVVVTAASATSICSNTALDGATPGATTLGVITISEGPGSGNRDNFGNSGFGWTASITLVPPAGWQFSVTPVPTYSITSGAGDLSAVTQGSFTTSQLVVNLTGNNNNNTDAFTITGLSVVPVTTAAAAGNVIANAASNVTGATSATYASLAVTPSSISGGLSLCTGSLSTLSSATGGGTWSASNANVTITGSTGAVGTFVATAAGTSTVSYTAGGCTTVRVVSVNLTPAAITGAFGMCFGASSTLSSTTAGGSWTASNGNVAVTGSTGAVGTFSATAAGTSTVVYTASGCTASQVVTVHALPVITTVNTGGAVCDGSTLNFNGAATGSGTIHYLWTGPSAFNNTNQNPSIPSAGVSNAGTYTLTVTDDPTGCTAFGTTIATVNVTPTSILGNSGAICKGATLSLSASPAGSATGTWSSSVPAVGTVGSASGIFTGLSTTTATTTVSYISACPTITTIVTVNPIPAAISGGNAVCEGATITLSDADAGGTWTSSNGFVTLTGTATQTVSITGVTGNNTSSINYTFPTGCSVSIPRIVSVNSLPSISASILTNPVCVGAALSFSATATNGAGTGGALSFSWTGPVALAAVATPSVTASLAADGSYVAKVTDSKSCFKTATVVATVNPTPAAILGGNDVCLSSSITLSDADAGGTWTSSNGNVSLAGVATPTATVTGATGNTTTTISYTFSTGCKATKTLTINSLPNISSVITGGAVCIGTALSFTATATAGSAGGAPTFSWNLPGPGSLAATGTPSLMATSVSQSGTYTVTVSDAKCSKDGNVNAVVNLLPTIGSLTLGSVNPMCSSQSLILNANTVNGTGSADHYTWTGPSAFSATTNGATPTQSHTVAVGAAGVYTVTVTFPGLGCTSAPVVSPAVTINATPVTSTTGTRICDGENTNLTLNAVPFSTFTWNAVDAGTITGSSSNASPSSLISDNLSNSSNSATGTIIYSVTPTSLPGCVGNVASVVVTVFPTPVITPTVSVSTCGALNLVPGVSFPSTYSWTVANMVGTVNGASASFGNTVSQALSNPSSSTPSSIDYFITPSYTITGGHTCAGSPVTTTVSVNPGAALTGVTTGTVCSGATLNFTVTPTTPSTISWVGSVASGSATFVSPTSGTVNPIPIAITNSSNSTAAIITFTVTPSSSGGGCSGGAGLVTVTVNPSPVVTNTTSATICSGVTLGLGLTASVGGGSFTWGQKSVTGGITGGSAGPVPSGTINNTLTNPSNNTAGAVVYSVFATSPEGCTSLAEKLVTVNVNPKPTMTQTAVATCNATSPAFALSASVSSTFAWTLGTNTGGISGAVASSGSSLNQTLFNPSSSSPGSIEYIVTPTSTGGGCAGNTTTITVSVNPSASLNAPVSTTICSGQTLNFTVTPSTPSNITWVGPASSGTATLSASSGATNPIVSTITTSSSTVPAIIVFTVTPSSSSGGCSGGDGYVTVTVNPAPTLTGATSTAICSGNLNLPVTLSTGGTINWLGGVGSGTVSGVPPSGTSNPLTATLSNTHPSVNGIVIFTVTPTSTLGCLGAAAPVTVTVYPTPVMTSTNTVTTCSAVNLPLTASTAGANTFSYVAANTGTVSVTGFNPTSLTAGSINQTLINQSDSSDAVVTYSVTPTSAIGGCIGTMSTVTVSVNPAAALRSPTSTAICSGTALNFMVTPSTPSSLSWLGSVTSGSVTGVSTVTASGNPITSAVLTNASNTTPAIVTFTVTPSSSSGGCSGAQGFVTVTVNPTPVLTSTVSPATCANTSPEFKLTASTAPAGGGIDTFNWTIGAIGADLSGATASGGDSIRQTLFSTNHAFLETVQYIVTPTSSKGCIGSPVTLTVTVNPTPTMTSTVISTCSNTSPAYSLTPTATTPSSFTWVTSSSAIILGAFDAGGYSINQTLINTLHNLAGSINYSVTPISDTGHCAGAVAVVQVVVNPAPLVSGTTGGASSVSVCSSSPLNIPLFASTSSTFSWTVGTITGSISGANDGASPVLISDTLTDPSNLVPGTVAFNVTATSTVGLCQSDPFTITAIVNPSPVLGNSSSASICSDVALNIPLTASVPSSFSWGFVSTTGGVTGGGSSSTSTIDNTLNNPSSTTAGSVVYTVLPTSTTGSCVAQSIATINVVVNPTPVITSSLTYSVCSGLAPVISLIPSTPSTFVSTVGAVTGGITGASGSSSAIISQVLTNPSNSAIGTQVYLVTPTSITGSCAPTSPTPITVTVDPAPGVSSALTGSICSGKRPDVNPTLVYSITATTGTDATFIWNTASTSSANITDNSHLPFSNASVITDTVVNSSDSTVGTISYTVVPTSGLGCVGPVSTITFTVNPVPHVAGFSEAICSKFNPAIQLAPITSVASNYNWLVNNTTLVTAATNSGTTNVLNDVLTNTGNTSVGTIVFTVTPTSSAAGCTGFPSLFTVSVNPTPKLRTVDHAAICSESPFVYQATSSTDAEGGNTQYAWHVQTLNGNTVPQTLSTDSTGLISEDISSNQVHTQSTVNFAYRLVSRGCISDTNVILTVNPRPEKPVITASAPSSICANTMFQNFGANIPVDSGHVFYHWLAGPDAVIFDTSTSGVNRNILVNFPTAGIDSVKVIAYVDTFVGCTSSAVSVITVRSSVADDPARVVYHNHMFICLKNDVDTFGYLWGFDEAGTLVADTLKNEVNQSYYNANPDTLHKFFWVIANHSECPQKSYYNNPHSTIRGVVPPAEEVGIKIYPNPASSDIRIEFGDISGAEYTADIYDVTGRKMTTVPIKDLITSVSVKDFSTGCYIIECRKNGIKVAISRFIKN